MDSPSTPSIMGSENPKFTERRDERSESDSVDLNMNGDMAHRKSKDGISREERMKMVRERQLEDHKRRLDELRQAQIHAMKAKQQLDDERRRRLDEIKGREDQRRAAVEARRKRIEDIERARRDAILRKHQEIFDKIDLRRRNHESRRMAFGTSTYRLADQDSVYTNSASRRAISAGALSRRGNITQRSHHQSTAAVSPGHIQSARLHPSPGTPSRAGGPLDSVSGNSSENSPVHSGRRIEGKHFRVSQSQPPVARSRAPPETARSRQGGSRPLPHSEGSKTERARRPTSLITREGSDPQKAAAKRSTDTFKIMSKRSQSVGNVSRNKGKETERMRPTSSHRDVGEVTEIFSKEMDSGETDGLRTPEPDPLRSSGRKVISEHEAKAALAEKRRLARLKAEAERNKADELSSSFSQQNELSPAATADDAQPSILITDDASSHPDLQKTERSQSIVTFENDEAMMEHMRSLENLTSGATVVRDEGETVARNGEDEEMAEMEGSSATFVRDGGPDSGNEVMSENVEPETKDSALMESVTAEGETVVPMESSLDIGDGAVEMATETVIRDVEPAIPDVIPVQKMEAIALSPEPEQKPATQQSPEPTATYVHDGPLTSPPLQSDADRLREETERRRLEAAQVEEEEREKRRRRLEAIREKTKSTNSPASGTPSTLNERLSSPLVENRPIDALENARKLLQRKAMGASLDSPSSGMNSPSNGVMRPLGDTPSVESSPWSLDPPFVEKGVVVEGHSRETSNGMNGHYEGEMSTTNGPRNSNLASDFFDPFGAEPWSKTNSEEHRTSSVESWNSGSHHMNLAADGDMLLNFDDTGR